jgi:uncharacterized protein with von Willebrand factor type A (vWA) domain
MSATRSLFGGFFHDLRRAGVPVTLKEYLTLLEAVREGVAGHDVERFYYLSRSTLVKDERFLDRFDLVFQKVFQGLEGIDLGAEDLPESWLRQFAERVFTPEELAAIQAKGGWEEVMEELRKRLAEQQERHECGPTWIGTLGTSPFGAMGFNPMGVRIGQDKGRHGSALKVWDKREYRNFDDGVELGTRNLKVALRRLRRFAREGAEEEFDLPGTVRATAKNGGWLDLQMARARRNRTKILLLLDVGGSMDEHVRRVEELFSAVRSEFQHLEPYYFHNCLYERVWRDNRRRHDSPVPTLDLFRTYGPEWRVVFVGDATMSPYEVTQPGGSVEHHNDEPGEAWMRRAARTWRRLVWLNPVPERMWGYTPSVAMVRALVRGRMFPLTLRGLEDAIRDLGR